VNGQETLDYDENVPISAFPFGLARQGEGVVDFHVEILHPITGEAYHRWTQQIDFTAEGSIQLEERLTEREGARALMPPDIYSIPMPHISVPDGVDVVNLRVSKIVNGESVLEYDENVPVTAFPFESVRQGAVVATHDLIVVL